MRKIIFSIFLVLTVFCSSAMSETASEWFDKANSLWDENGGRFTDPKTAIEYLNNTIKLQPDYDKAYLNRGIAYANLSQYHRAITDYNEAIRLKPDDSSAYLNRGRAYSKLDQYKLALKDFDESIRLKPDFMLAYITRGTAYFIHRNKKLACSDAQKACELGDCKLLELSKRKKFCR
jgi:tetratricopeptide (TPR) repeat protein